MEFLLDNGNGIYRLAAYHEGAIKVNKRTYNFPIIVTPQALLAPWGPYTMENLKAEHINQTLPFSPQVVLLGTGKTLHFPDLKIFASLMEHNIGFEIMDTAAACRTYTVLMAEGREVAACLLC